MKIKVSTLVVGAIIAVEIAFLSYSTQVMSTEQNEILILSLSLLPLALAVIYLLEPKLHISEKVVTLPSLPPLKLKKEIEKEEAELKPRQEFVLPSLEKLRSDSAIFEKYSAGGQPAKPKPVQKKEAPLSQVRKRPEIISLVPQTLQISEPTTGRAQLPTITPRGLIKAPQAAPKEKFATIVPQMIKTEAAPKPYRMLEKLPDEELDIKTLISKAKGMKYSLVGWWPLGWSRVITDPDLPEQFWKIHKGKISKGVLMGYDSESKQFVAWVANVTDGKFTKINEMVRTKNQEELITSVKKIMKESDFQEAEAAQEIGGEQ